MRGAVSLNARPVGMRLVRHDGNDWNGLKEKGKY